MEKIRVFLVDDHTVVRHGLKQILAEEFKKAIFGEARNATEALDLFRNLPALAE